MFFRRTLRIRPSPFRGAAALIALLTVVLGVYVAGLAQLGGLLVTLVVMLLLEADWRQPRPGAPTPAT
jgi:hypothetical protein